MFKLSLFFRLRLSLILVIGTALINVGNWHFLLIYLIGASGWIFCLKAPYISLIKLIGLELVFFSIIALPLGVGKAIFLIMRALICLLVMNSFLLTIPKYHLAIALKGLPLPTSLQQITILTAQYLEILLSEIKQMQTAAQLRGLKGNTQWLRYINASMIGSLYLRTLDRAQRVTNAMVIRGYNGNYPLEINLAPKENFFLIICSMIAFMLTLSSYGAI